MVPDTLTIPEEEHPMAVTHPSSREFAELIDAAKNLTDTLTAAYKQARTVGSPMVSYIGSATVSAAETLESLAYTAGILTVEAQSDPHGHEARAIFETLIDAGLDVAL